MAGHTGCVACPPHLSCLCSRQLPQCALREKVALGDLTPPQQQLSAFLQQLQALKPSRSAGLSVVLQSLCACTVCI